jgi:HEAT repeat protein
MKIKELIQEALEQEDYERLIQEAQEHGGKIVHGLIRFLTSTDEKKKWAAVTALGLLTARLYALNPEGARRVLRQLIWNLNDESGGIGWGMPEAFAEILSVVPPLQKEYSPLLIAYISDGPCFIENEYLQKGVVWGLGRLKNVSEELKNKALPFLIKALTSPDDSLRGTAVWALGELEVKEAVPILKSLQTDNQMVKIFNDNEFQEKTLSEWTRASLKKLEKGGE